MLLNSFPWLVLLLALHNLIVALTRTGSLHAACMCCLAVGGHVLNTEVNHHGDLIIPKLRMGVYAQPSNEAELCNAVATAVAIDDQPSCFRFPRGNGIGVDFAAYGVSEKLKGTPWEVMHYLHFPGNWPLFQRFHCPSWFLGSFPAMLSMAVIKDACVQSMNQVIGSADWQGCGEERGQGRGSRVLRNHDQQRSCSR